MIKAVFFDIDGTLLSFTTHRVSEGTVKAFDLLHQNGIRTFIASGRPQVLIPTLPVTFEGYCTMNGGYVTADGVPLLKRPIPQDESDRWLDYCHQHALCIMVFTETAMYVCNLNDAARALHGKLQFEMPPERDAVSLIGSEIYQIIVLGPPSIDAVITSVMPSCRTPRWCDAFTDVVREGNDKATGLSKICDYYGIRREETMAIGDGANDIEMLEWAAVGVAMGNADDTVKAHARWVTTDVDQEGILHAVERLLKLESLKRQLHDYEELSTAMLDDMSFVARGNGFCDTKYSDLFLEEKMQALRKAIAALE